MSVYFNSFFDRIKTWIWPDQTNHFESVPPEIIKLIFIELIPKANEEIQGYQDLLKVGVVSRRFNSIVKEMPQYKIALQISKLLKDNLLVKDKEGKKGYEKDLDTKPVGSYFIFQFFYEPLKQYAYKLTVQCGRKHLYHLENNAGTQKGDIDTAFLYITNEGFSLAGAFDRSYLSKTYHSIDDLIKVFLLGGSFHSFGVSPLDKEGLGAYVYRNVEPFYKYSFSYIDENNEIKDIYFIITPDGFKIEGDETIYSTIDDLHKTMMAQAKTNNFPSWFF